MEDSGVPEGFEVFEHFHTPFTKNLLVTMRRQGNFCLNRTTFEALGKPEAVKLFYHRTKRQVAFRATKSNEANAIPVRKMSNSANWVIAGVSFAKAYGIDVSVSRRYTGTLSEHGIVIDLNSEVVDASKPRKQQKETTKRGDASSLKMQRNTRSNQ